MHLIIGILFLLLIIFLVTMYIVVGGFIALQIVKAMKFILVWRPSKNNHNAWIIVNNNYKDLKKRIFDRKIVIIFFSIVITFHLTIYFNQRVKWLG